MILSLLNPFSSLRGRRLKGKEKGVLDARETRGAREEGGTLAFLSHLKLPFPSLSNACHAVICYTAVFSVVTQRSSPKAVT